MSKSAWRSHGIVALTVTRPRTLPNQVVGTTHVGPAPIRALRKFGREVLSSFRTLVLGTRGDNAP